MYTTNILLKHDEIYCYLCGVYTYHINYVVYTYVCNTSKAGQDGLLHASHMYTAVGANTYKCYPIRVILWHIHSFASISYTVSPKVVEVCVAVVLDLT